MTMERLNNNNNKILLAVKIQRNLPISLLLSSTLSFYGYNNRETPLVPLLLRLQPPPPPPPSPHQLQQSLGFLQEGFGDLEWSGATTAKLRPTTDLFTIYDLLVYHGHEPNSSSNIHSINHHPRREI